MKLIIIELGASFIKLAQVLATRADFFSKEYLDELKDLHDQLPAMNEKAFKRVFNEAFENSPFDSFDNNPIASASIAEVHIAYLKGKKVAVKLRREDIKDRVLADINIINFFNFLFKPLFSYYTKNSIEAVISEFSLMVKDEVNLLIELSNLEKFRETYKQEGIYFPTPKREYCSTGAIVMSFEEGYRFDNKEAILKANIDFNKIISNLVYFYTKQMLITGLFHADPHPGNLLVKENGDLIFLDFGMVKSVPNNTRIAIIELIKSANERDYELFISANKRLGTVAYEAPTSELAEFSSKMFDIFANDNLTSENMQDLAFEVLDATRKMPFKLPSDAIYILRVSAIIEGLGTTYIENFNGIKDILPVLEKNIPKALGAKEKVSEVIFNEFKDIPFVVKDIKTIIKKMSEGSLTIEVSTMQLEWISKTIKTTLKPILTSFALMLFSFFLLFYDKDLKDISLIIFILAFIRLIYK